MRCCFGDLITNINNNNNNNNKNFPCLFFLLFMPRGFEYLISYVYVTNNSWILLCPSWTCIFIIIIYWGGEGWLGFLDLWSGQITLMEVIFNPYGELRRSPEDSVNQIHSRHLHVGAPGIFSYLLRSVQMLKREGVRKAAERYRTYLV